jgi:hypothetical protein
VTVPLSDREQKILQEIERDLFREDPTFARDAQRPARFSDAAKARLGALVFLVGFLTLIAYFVVASAAKSEALSLVLGVAAFAGMVAGIVMFISSVRSLAAREGQPRERLVGAVKQWEARLRERYKRR